MNDHDPTPLRIRVGQRIRALRRTQHLTADDLATRLGWPKDTLINYEHGRRALTLDRLEALAAALTTSPLALLTANDRLAALVEQIARDEALLDHVAFFLDALRAELDAPEAIS